MSSAAPSGRAASGATPKQRLLFRLMRERVHLLGAYQGLTRVQMEESPAPGKWSVRDVLAHITSWELTVVDALLGARGGSRPAMMDFSVEEEQRWNEDQHARTGALSLEDVVRGFQLTRLELLDQLEVLPEEPVQLWEVDHPVGWMIDKLARHDRHHADAIKQWRGERGY